jgi:hypothetical protein
MTTADCPEVFKTAATKLDQRSLDKRNILTVTGSYLDSPYLKLYKTAWANPSPDPPQSPSRIFFSVWTDEKAITDGRLRYNIHALKLRYLKDYKIESRKFAEAFRKAFKSYKSDWPNVSLDFGPLTLIEGWVKTSDISFEKDTLVLAKRFLEIEHLVDETLLGFRLAGNRLTV